MNFQSRENKEKIVIRWGEECGRPGAARLSSEFKKHPPPHIYYVRTYIVYMFIVNLVLTIY